MQVYYTTHLDIWRKPCESGWSLLYKNTSFGANILELRIITVALDQVNK